MNKNLVCTVFVFLNLVARGIARPEVTEEKVKAALPKLTMLATQTLQKTGVPGLAIAVVYQDKVVYLKGFGVREVGKPETVDADTVFQLASVSKPLDSTVVAALITDGTITWDSRIADLDPTFRMYDPWVTHEVTLRDLLAHRSGLPDHAGDLLEDLGYSREEILYRLRYQKSDSSLRAHYAYTNFGFTAAAVAAAKAPRGTPGPRTPRVPVQHLSEHNELVDDDRIGRDNLVEGMAQPLGVNGGGILGGQRLLSRRFPSM